jgi:hypothetical protein
MLLQQIWQTAYNQIFRVRQIIVHVYFNAYDRIRDRKIRFRRGYDRLIFCTRLKIYNLLSPEIMGPFAFNFSYFRSMKALL